MNDKSEMRSLMKNLRYWSGLFKHKFCKSRISSLVPRGTGHESRIEYQASRIESDPFGKLRAGSSARLRLSRDAVCEIRG
jgi:hypothetical protein